MFHAIPITDKIRSCFKRLTELGIVELLGRNKYILARGLYDVVGKSGIHTRLTGLDRDTKKALLVAHIKRSGDKGAPLKELHQVLPELNRNQLQFFVRELQSNGTIYSMGKTNGTRWFLAKTDG